MAVAYKVDFKYNNDLILLDVAITIFSKTVLNKELSNKEKIILRTYLLNGYSKETKENIKLELDISTENLNTVNYYLQKKGFLKPHPKNQRLKVITKKLEELQSCFVDNDSKKLFIVNFIDE